MGLDLTFKPQKFRELVLFVAAESESDPHFGATKLNKILYFSDFHAFGLLGTAITGATYVRMDRGPVPREMLPALREMEAEGAIAREERRYFHLLQKRVVARQDADLSVFSESELEIVRNVLAELRHMNASQVSALSHLEVGWQHTPPNGVISYGKVYISNRPLSAREVEAFRKRVRDDASQSAVGE